MGCVWQFIHKIHWGNRKKKSDVKTYIWAFLGNVSFSQHVQNKSSEPHNKHKIELKWSVEKWKEEKVRKNRTFIEKLKEKEVSKIRFKQKHISRKKQHSTVKFIYWAIFLTPKIMFTYSKYQWCEEVGNTSRSTTLEAFSSTPFHIKKTK